MLTETKQMNDDMMLDSIINAVNAIAKHENSILSDILRIKGDFTDTLDKLKSELPYTMNLLDEVRPNENAHSRMLIRLLQYSKDDGKYPLLESFLKHIGEPFNTLEFETPVFSAEKDRIDGRIRDAGKARQTMIIENKIHGAYEREKQVKRYIEKELNAGYKKIYVLYLTRSGGGASEQSLPSDLKRNPDIIYKDINFRDHILKWITEIEKNYDFTREVLLKSALVQYLNHVQGMFNQREGEREMANKMSDMLIEKFEIDKKSNSYDKIRKISEFKDYANNMVKYLDEASDKIMFEALKDFEDNLLQGEYQNMTVIKERANLRFGEVGSSIIFKPNDWNNNYSMKLDFEGRLSGLFFGIRNYKDDSKETSIQEFKTILPDTEKGNPYWLYWVWIQEFKNNDSLIENIEKGLCGRIQDLVSKTYKDTLKVAELRRCDSTSPST